MHEHTKNNFRTDIGQNAEVDRVSTTNTEVLKCNKGLRVLGEQLKKSQPPLREAEYLGSIAVHYYKTPMLSQTFFISQTATLGKTPEILVQEGITELRNSCLSYFGHNPQLRRSGI